MEKTNEAPDWAKELISTVEELKQRVDTTYPEAEKSKKPDFSAFVERLKFTGKIPDK
ncbi:MAG TPA: hypothetical protein PLH60_08625 [Proteiniphilum sp.]|nr:hypothetical protein [Proteiniphilum sp.]HPJ50970.1 hypothetical protein [Proteiniphilum sp.]HPR20606.1 hypothetical protein [Proteiniphilum sp.]